MVYCSWQSRLLLQLSMTDGHARAGTCGRAGECISDLAALARDCPSYMAAITVRALTLRACPSTYRLACIMQGMHHAREPARHGMFVADHMGPQARQCPGISCAIRQAPTMPFAAQPCTCVAVGNAPLSKRAVRRAVTGREHPGQPHRRHGCGAGGQAGQAYRHVRLHPLCTWC